MYCNSYYYEILKVPPHLQNELNQVDFVMNKIIFLIFFIIASAIQIDCHAIQNPDTLTYKVEGDKVVAFFYSSGKINSPTLFFIHGFMDSGDKWNIGSELSKAGINVFIIDHRGCYLSEGKYSMMNAQQDIDWGIRFLNSNTIRQKYHMNSESTILGGYSFGGGMALTYAKHHPEIKRVITIAGPDIGKLHQEFQQDSYAKSMFEAILETTSKPYGPIQYAYKHPLLEFAQKEDYFKIIGSSTTIKGIDILMIGAKNDQTVNLHHHTLPLYSYLKPYNEAHLKIYDDGHSFHKVKKELVDEIIYWIIKKK